MACDEVGTVKLEGWRLGSLGVEGNEEYTVVEGGRLGGEGRWGGCGGWRVEKRRGGGGKAGERRIGRPGGGSWGGWEHGASGVEAGGAGDCMRGRGRKNWGLWRLRRLWVSLGSGDGEYKR